MTDDAAALLVLTGPPGAGKTTAAGLLVGAAPRAVHLLADSFWDFIKQGWVAPYLEGSQHQNAVVMAALGAAAAEYAAGGYFVVLEGIIGPWFLPDAVQAAAARGIALHYAVLRPSADVAMSRAMGRGDTDTLPVDKMYRAFAELGEYERHVIDTTSLTPREAADAVQRALDAGDLRVER